MRFISPRGATGGLGRESRLFLFLIISLAVLLLLPVAGFAKGGGGQQGIDLKVQGSHLVVAGTSVRFNATARPADPGSKIKLQRLLVGGDWITVDTKPMVGMSTVVSFELPVSQNSKYRVVWGSKTSKTVDVKVFALVTVTAQLGTYVTCAGTPISISGSVLPASPGRTIKINVQKWIDGGFFTIAVLRTPLTAGPNGTSLYAAVWNALQPGTYRFIARMDKTSLAMHGQAISSTITL
jgi:hypothetical protein